jgi:hypothetical protein
MEMRKSKSSFDELVLFCTKVDLNNFDKEQFLNLLNSNFDWDEVINCLLSHGLFLIFYNACRIVDSDPRAEIPIPSWVLGKMRDISHHLLSHELLQEAFLKELLFKAAEESVPIIVLKGFYLNKKVYSCKSVRYSSDIDLLIHQEDLKSAELLVKAQGFKGIGKEGGFEFPWRKPYPALNLVRDGLINLEIHWQFPPGKLYKRLTKVNMEEIWNQSSIIKINNMPFYQMRAEHLLIYLCLHLSIQHKFTRLIWLRDLKETLICFKGSFDWNYFVDCAKRWQVATYTYFSLHVAKKLLGVEIPTEVQEEIRPRFWGAKLLERMLSEADFINTSGRMYQPVFTLFSILADTFVGRIYAVITAPNHILFPIIKRSKLWRAAKRTSFWISLRRVANIFLRAIFSYRREKEGAWKGL